MTKEQFLKDFDDINFMYNNAMMKDSLERHIDELLEDETEKIKAKIENVVYCIGGEDLVYWEDIEEILDKHISELKGGNK